MNSFFKWLCNPVVIYILSLTLALAFQIGGRRKAAYFFFVAGIFWIVLVSATPFSQWVVFSLERQYPAFKKENFDLAVPVNILVLGGGHSENARVASRRRDPGTSPARLLEGLRIYSQITNSKLVGTSLRERMRLAGFETEVIDLYAHDTDTLHYRSPRNTNEEIRAYKKRFAQTGTLILVTSASHMPRAMMLCKRYGVNAIPAPTEFYVNIDSKKRNFDFKPSVTKIEMMESAMHEYAGMVKAKWID